MDYQADVVSAGTCKQGESGQYLGLKSLKAWKQKQEAGLCWSLASACSRALVASPGSNIQGLKFQRLRGGKSRGGTCRCVIQLYLRSEASERWNPTSV